MLWKALMPVRRGTPDWAMIAAAFMVAPLWMTADPAYAAAPGRIYWTEYVFLNPLLKSMDLDGSDLQTVALPSEFFQAFTVAVDAESNGGFVLHSTAFGMRTSTVDLTSGAIVPDNVTIDHGQALGLHIQRDLHRLYWADTLGSGCGNGVFYFDYQTGDSQLLFAGCLKPLNSNPVADPVTGRVYFGWFGTLVSVAADGSDLRTVSPVAIDTCTLALHPQAQHIYWLENDGELWRMNYAGDGVTSIATNLFPMNQGGGLQIDRVNGRLYWINTSSKTIHRCALDGSNPQTIYTAPAELNLGGIDVVVPLPSKTPGDVTGDGVVNIDDLLAVINGWGVCPSPPTTCAADINDDQQVNVDDLLVVISNWS